MFELKLPSIVTVTDSASVAVGAGVSRGCEGIIAARIRSRRSDKIPISMLQSNFRTSSSGHLYYLHSAGVAISIESGYRFIRCHQIVGVTLPKRH